MRKLIHNILFYLLSKEIASKIEAGCKAVVCRKESIDAAYIRTLEKEVEYLKDKLSNFSISIDHSASYRDMLRQEILRAKPGHTIKCNLLIDRYEIINVKVIVCPDYNNLREFIITVIERDDVGVTSPIPLLLQGATDYWKCISDVHKLIHTYHRSDLKDAMENLSLQGFFTRIGK